jgi:anti-sigma regulatory factor (Ser/Thr protein kinase)
VPTATLAIPPEAQHVRVARMVAGAAARRGRVPEDVIDDVRLAVGEAVARVVLRHGRAGIPDEVEIALRDDPESFEVEIVDHSPADLADDDDGLSVALTQSVVPQSWISTADGHQRIRLVWPLEDALAD